MGVDQVELAGEARIHRHAHGQRRRRQVPGARGAEGRALVLVAAAFQEVDVGLGPTAAMGQEVQNAGRHER